MDIGQKELDIVQKLLRKLDSDTITKQDFVQSFEAVIAIIAKLGQSLLGKQTEIGKNFDELKANLKSANSGDLSDIKAKVKTTVQSEIRSIIAETNNRLGKAEKTVSEFQQRRQTDKAEVIAELVKMIPEVPAEETGITVRNKLEKLTGKERLDKSAIRGLEELIDEAVKKGQEVSIGQGRGRGGVMGGLFVYIDGVKKGTVRMINFKAGVGMAISYSKVNGLDTITFQGGSAVIDIETPSEAPNSIIVEFTVSAEPQYVVADGTTYFAGAGYSYSSGTGKITMDVAPSASIRAII